MRLGWSVVTAIVIATAIGGCASVLQAEVNDYGGLQVECVNVADSRPAADSCRLAVRNYYCKNGGPLNDAGACD